MQGHCFAKSQHRGGRENGVVHSEVVGGRIRIFFVSPHRRGEIGGIPYVTHVGRLEADLASSTGVKILFSVKSPLPGERHLQDRPIERLDVDSSFGAAHGEMTPPKALHFQSCRPHRCCRSGILENRQHIVRERVIFRGEHSTSMTLDSVRLAENPNSEIDDVTAQFEHSAARELSDHLPVRRRHQL